MTSYYCWTHYHMILQPFRILKRRTQHRCEAPTSVGHSVTSCPLFQLWAGPGAEGRQQPPSQHRREQCTRAGPGEGEQWMTTQSHGSVSGWDSAPQSGKLGTHCSLGPQSSEWGNRNGPGTRTCHTQARKQVPHTDAKQNPLTVSF